MTVFLIQCRQCPAPTNVVVSFPTDEERARWERVHNRATGHNLYDLTEAES